ncbi:hypothetical protein [Azospirillum argentinense]|uniref:SufE family protein n=1 Tax=Azospirillum argentinense TaxID=2970906 RepID=UPI0032DF526E
MTESVAEALDRIAGNLRFFDDWADRFQYLIDLGRALPAFPEEWRTEANRMDGCQAAVWLVAGWRDGRLHAVAASDSVIVAGLVAILLDVFQGRTAREILDAPPDIAAVVGLSEHLSASRRNGLAGMIQRIRDLARTRLDRTPERETP